MYDRFQILNANIGDVLYMRINGKVNAVKLVKILCGRPTASANHDATYAWFLIAGGGDEPKMMYVGFHNTTKFYRTIEDCINDSNSVEKRIVTAKEIAERCGMEVEAMRTNFGMGYWGCWKFKWDGYMPKRISVSTSQFNFICDENGWHYDVYQYSYEKEPKKYYDTYEECIADNRVKVIVF